MNIGELISVRTTFDKTMEANVIDLFEHYETLPNEVRVILDKYSTNDNSYENCRALKGELEPLGYTFEWGLSGEPYNLTKII